ncbi:MAG: DcrB-related protein [Cyanobacteria bacterium REEB67]|nr:DcrB-related protein [Cyanobacteria bacterium REEB67]
MVFKPIVMAPMVVPALLAGAVISVWPANAQHSEQIAATYLSNVPMAAYRLTGTTLTINYPRNWKVDEKPDKDTLVKFSGTISEGLFGAVTVAVSPQNQLSLATFCKVLEEAHLSKLPGYRKLAEANINFGADRKMVGLSRVISLDMGGTRITQRWIVFPLGSDFGCMTFISPSEQYEKIAPLFNDMLLRLASGSASSKTAVRAATASSSPVRTTSGAEVGRSGDNPQYVNIKANGTPLAFSYPQDWQVEEAGESNHLLKIIKKGAPANASELSLYCSDMPPNTSVEQLLNGLEEKIYNGKKNYRLVSRQALAFGSGAGVEGVEQEISFEHNGVPLAQRMVSFVVKDKFYLLTLISSRASDVNGVNSRILFNHIKASLSVSD